MSGCNYKCGCFLYLLSIVYKYVKWLDLLNCHIKFNGFTISRSRGNDVESCCGNFPEISELKFSLPLEVTDSLMWPPIVVHFAVVTIPLNLCPRKTRSETQLRITVAVPSRLANHNKINSFDILVFFIFLTSISCDGTILLICFYWFELLS